MFSNADKLDNGCIRLADARLQHLREVLDAAPGDALRVGEIGGKIGSAELLSLANDAATLQVTLDQAPPPKLPITVILALPRPKMLRRILRNVAELGIPELHLINSYRVEKSYWQTPVLQEAAVRDYFLQGLQQSRDTILPRLFLHQRFKPFVEDELKPLIGGRLALLAHPGNYPPCPASIAAPTLLLIGPEGGFIPYEVEKLQHHGCQAVSLGPRILRVENAITALIARIAAG